MNLDPALANKLFADGAVLVIAGVPVGTEFGIDLCSYTIGENFRGVKMIPPGLHIVWCASQGRYGDAAPRVGFAHFFHVGEVLVREWDHDIEELRERQIADPELEKRRIRENLRELDRFLAPYDYRFVGEWKQLTDSVSESVLHRCRPALGGTVRTNVTLQSCPDSERPRGSTPKVQHAKNSQLITDENDLLPQLKPIEGTVPQFTILPPRVPPSSEPADVSRHSMDCIEAVDALIDVLNANALVEEIQLAFAFFLVAYSVESLAQWRKILNLFSHSETAVGKYKLLYMKYSEILAKQLPRLPEELLEPTEHNTVYKDVRQLLTNLHAGGLNLSAERLSLNLEKSMQWSFVGIREDNPEDMPVMVEMT